MHRKEINDRSPLRVLEKSIHGGLGRGNLGVIVARHGVGKTAFLVGVALDDLLRGKNVFHVTLEDPIEKVCAFYDEVFTDLARTQELEDVWRARKDLERHRLIQGFVASKFSADRLRSSLDFWSTQMNFRPAAILIDGYDFAPATAEELIRLKKIAADFDAELWMSAHTWRAARRNEHGIPEPLCHLEDGLDVILTMAHDGNGVHVGVHKDHDNPIVSDLKLALDPTTMLLIRE